MFVVCGVDFFFFFSRGWVGADSVDLCAQSGLNIGRTCDILAVLFRDGSAQGLDEVWLRCGIAGG